MINSIFEAVIQVILQAAFYILVLKAHWYKIILFELAFR